MSEKVFSWTKPKHIWEPYEGKIDKNTLVIDYHRWWCFVYKKPTVADITFCQYRINNRHLFNFMPDVKLKDLNRNIYQEFINKYAETHEKQTVDDLNNQLKRPLRDACYEGLIDRDPTYGIITSGVKPKPRHQKFLSEHELKKLLNVLDYGNNIREMGAKNSWLVYLAAKTGARFAELLGLTPKDFDFKNNEVSIDKTWNHRTDSGGFMPTKNKSSVRRIGIDQKTALLFKTLLKDMPENEPVFVAEARLFNSTINKYLKRKCEEARVPVITMHSLRHTHASILIAKGVTMISISKRLGHANLTTTQKVYLHITEELAVKDDNKLNVALANF